MRNVFCILRLVKLCFEQIGAKFLLKRDHEIYEKKFD